MEKITRFTPVIDLPEEDQKSIKKAVTRKLKTLGTYSPEAVEDALDSRLVDLEDTISIKRYINA